MRRVKSIRYFFWLVGFHCCLWPPVLPAASPGRIISGAGEAGQQSVGESEASTAAVVAASQSAVLQELGASGRPCSSAQQVVRHPTLHSEGPRQLFAAEPQMYLWLLDHPDKVVRIWRSLGAHCLSIVEVGNGTFGWSDGDGSSVKWQTLVSNTHARIWYAEGRVRPAPLFPTVAVKAVVVMHYGEHRTAKECILEQRAEVFLQTDSMTVTLITGFLGASAPHLAEQCLTQLEIFFSGIAWYFERHPERTDLLLSSLVDEPASRRTSVRASAELFRPAAAPGSK